MIDQQNSKERVAGGSGQQRQAREAEAEAAAGVIRMIAGRETKGGCLGWYE
jgi:hypothetical protein